MGHKLEERRCFYGTQLLSDIGYIRNSNIVLMSKQLS